MATESPVRMLAGTGLNGSIGGLSENFRGSSSSSSSREAQELSLLLRERSRLENIHYNHDMLLHRSESAPPSVEGSQAAIDFLTNQPTGLGALNRFSKMGVGDEAEQELRSDPAYLAYYYSHINLNPRLPPPLISWENWHLAQKLQSGLSMAESKDRMKLRSFDDNSSKSLFSLQPLLPTHKEEPEHFEDKRSLENFAKQTSREWAEARADAMMAAGLGNRPKSLVDLIQEDFPRTPSPVYNLSRSSSRAANDEGIDAAAMEMQLSHFRELASGMSSNQVGTQVLGDIRDPKGVGVEDISVTGGLGSRSVTPKPGLMFGGSSSSVRSGSPAPQSGAPGLPSTFNSGVSETRSGPGTNMSKASTVAELAASLHGININDVQGSSMIDQRGQSQQGQGDHDEQHSLQLQQHRQQRSQAPVHSQFSQSPGHQQAFQKAGTDQGYRGQSKFQTPSLQTSGNASATSNVYAAAAAAAAMSYIAAGNPYYQNLHSSALYAPNYGLGGYPMSAAMMPSMLGGYPAPGGLPVPFDSAAAAAAAAAAVAANMGSQSVSGTSGATPDLQQYYKLAGQGGTAVPSAVQDALYLQYMQRAAEDARTAAVLADPSVLQGYMGGSRADSFDMHKGHLAAAMSYTADQRSQFARSGAVGVPIANRAVAASPGYYGSPPGLGMMMPYPNSPVGSPILPGSPVSNSGFSLRRDDRGSRLLCMPGRTGSLAWQTQRGSETSNELRGSVLLEEFKTSKSRRFELSDISGHVVEFSADQHGSRFIQQKLETATAEEKSMVFQEVLPQAFTLMTDVFGNYVIQKFFEHGNSQQRRELATQLVGRMLVLSLQMYGCRVIQKALEVVDVDQQTQLVSELDGHVMRCVRDQNGNHVIQKCIECVPPDRIQFIISAFYGQVVSLSTHPYGCRVIQRVLEHCTDEQKQSGIMEEILQATCSLAQDQYGNYVIQHVLEHGKPYERSEILTKLAGQIVQMSQHKFASNVVEKCLEFGGHTERQILINEMLGHTEENMPLQAMMKDQFANYVVQKVLETCDDQQREILLGRIKVHLHALKKYTYGKHIVARVEKLVAAGERRSAAHVTN